ncbi:cell wall-binding repeat-containing protein [Labedella gwakjiensis]|uniref:Cell wall-binding repeat-containing protein n=2 Tax=Labedella gwakjiensis TaxID=390269 RepID=A0ABY0CAV5_9MICO|nr:cell wall-binding repeat-containing protein [Labedella gwakjiensis]RUQ86746.1 cell wall-binding repeat-containing protein [Labedella gwakjiensis]
MDDGGTSPSVGPSVTSLLIDVGSSSSGLTLGSTTWTLQAGSTRTTGTLSANTSGEAKVPISPALRSAISSGQSLTFSATAGADENTTIAGDSLSLYAYVTYDEGDTRATSSITFRGARASSSYSFTAKRALAVTAGQSVSVTTDRPVWASGPDGSWTTEADMGPDYWVGDGRLDDDRWTLFAPDAAIDDDGSTIRWELPLLERGLEASGNPVFAMVRQDMRAPGSSFYSSVYVRIPVVYTEGDPLVERISGSDRFQVAAAVSRAAYPSGAEVVVLASGAAFPDALSAAPAAARLGGPLLLTLPGRLPSVISEEIDRLEPSRLVIVGGEKAIGSSVEQSLESPGREIVRIAGANRYEVSAALAVFAFSDPPTSGAFVASGANFPDALSAGPAALETFDGPVILTNGTSPRIPQPLVGAIEDLDLFLFRIAGGPASVSTGIEADLKTIAEIPERVARIGKANRFATSVEIARSAFDTATTVYLASGNAFPDALTGSAWAAAEGAPLYLVPRNCVPRAVLADIAAFHAERIVVLGGTTALGTGVSDLTACSF